MTPNLDYKEVYPILWKSPPDLSGRWDLVEVANTLGDPAVDQSSRTCAVLDRRRETWPCNLAHCAKP